MHPRNSYLFFGFLCFIVSSLWLGIDTHASSFPQIKKRGRYSEFPDPIPQGDALKVRIPIKRSGNLLLLEVRIDSLVGNLILDTGAPHLVLNKTYFRDYPRYGSVMAAGITGGAGEGNQTLVKHLEISPGLFFTKVDADVIPLGHLESNKGVKILGLFGLNLLKRLEIHFHIGESEIVLYRLSKKGVRLAEDSTLKYPNKPIQISQENGLILINVTINERKLRFYFDTGAETNVLHSGASKKVFELVTLTKRNTLNGAGNNKVDILSGEISELLVDGILFSKLDVIITNLNAMRSAYETSIDGMLGYGFIARRDMGINFMKGEMYIWE